jgi:hypothetical protein
MQPSAVGAVWRENIHFCIARSSACENTQNCRFLFSMKLGEVCEKAEGSINKKYLAI